MNEWQSTRIFLSGLTSWLGQNDCIGICSESKISVDNGSIK